MRMTSLTKAKTSQRIHPSFKAKEKQIEYSTEHSKVMEAKSKEVMALISAEDLNLTEYSDTLVYRIVEKVTVLSSEEIKIRFIGGFEITQPLY